ncbi:MULTISPECIES: isochorismate synthase DhbC [Virgibacillus]|uniref:isochorismate synthase n=1 Tax=Virgibacillus kapii TaxID=1638645 RepID=A0ABQ2DCU2_9BACI|nr:MULTISPECIES: isochorismate synthase DhbC [Virgibacillus]EQB35743.1 hypothetical protein M948_11925 [Virgibacillus sp. CM-4]MYL41547.1 isochorismate synthase DhbC [Virgibacillus massiliensis]GGJ50113.1 isochorismate synthase DhbC [Virgibacillus kapii]
MINATATNKRGQAPLLEHYQKGDFFLASPLRTILGRGVYSTVDTSNNHGLSNQIRNALTQAKLAGQNKPIVVGAIPFSTSTAAKLVIPKDIRIGSSLSIQDDECKKASSSSFEIQAVPEPEAYLAGVLQGLDAIEAGSIQKIVLSRSLHITSANRIDTHQLLKNLAFDNKSGYTFAAHLSTENDHLEDRTLIGASPELLVSKMGEKIVANPLAGSRPRCKDPIEDEQQAKELLDSTKDLHEHTVVVEAVKQSLQGFCLELDVPNKPTVIKTEAMWHLSTEITGTLKDSQVTSIDLATALHPTPAVCGYPTEDARNAIEKIEPFDRGFFTGMVGWCDASGNGEWVVTIRCAEIQGNNLQLYAGAGIVAGSNPDDELAETAAKFGTMLQGMGI